MLFSPGHKNKSVTTILACILFAATMPVLAVSCKKAIEQQQRNIIIDAMTNGRWFVQQYKENSADFTADFSSYEFQFYENGNVDGITGGSIRSTGTWDADISNYTITATFPVNAGDTLKRLNYTWKITDSYLDYVEANTTTMAGGNILHLKKK